MNYTVAFLGLGLIVLHLLLSDQGAKIKCAIWGS